MKVFNFLKKLSINDWNNIMKKNKKYTCEYNFLNKKLKNHIQSILKN